VNKDRRECPRLHRLQLKRAGGNERGMVGETGERAPVVRGSEQRHNHRDRHHGYRLTHTLARQETQRTEQIT